MNELKKLVAEYLFNEDLDNYNYVVAVQYNNIINVSKLKYLNPLHKELFDIVIDLSELREQYQALINRYNMTEKIDYEENNKQLFDDAIGLILK